MWTRKELKEKGKKTFKKNYWNCVGAGFIMALFVGGLSSVKGVAKTDYRGFNELTEVLQEDGSLIGEVDDGEKSSLENALDSLDSDLTDAVEAAGNFDSIREEMEPEESVVFWGAFTIAVIIIVLVILATALAITVFVAEPIRIGCLNFFYKNLHGIAAFKEVFSGFGEGYTNRAKTMFFYRIKIALWTMLFIIPGAIKGYEYRMVPYLMAVNPNMSTKEAFEKSKEMMNGQKWNTFVYDLSFIGWGLLSVITLGLAGIFYVSPYKDQSDAALFEALYGGSAPEEDNFESYVEM